MNSDQVQALVRTLLVALGGYVVDAGYTDSSTWTAVAGALAIVAAFLWSMWFHAGPKKADAVAVATGEATGDQKVAVAKATR